MSRDVRVKAGLNLKLEGSALFDKADVPRSNLYIIKPTEFHGITPKFTVKEKDEVTTGDVLFFSKSQERIKFVSPVTGVIKEIKRGERRKVLSIIIDPKQEDTFKYFGKEDPLELDRDAILDKILESGIFPCIKQRPYDVIANPLEYPKSIFISSFDTAPLSPDYTYLLEEREEEFQQGINALTKLTKGMVYLGVDSDSVNFFHQVENVEIVRVFGKHPAGNVGVHIEATDPINQGERIWVLDPQSVALIGELFLTGKYNPRKLIALVGSKVFRPQYYFLSYGQSIRSFLKDKVDLKKSRIISGNVLTGTKIGLNDSIGFYDSMITVIPEGNKSRFFGWLPFLGSSCIHSASKTSFSWLNNKAYNLNTSLNGEERAFVLTGEMEKVVPLDIYPMHLLKACMANDIEKMENLGIYEVAPEDFALVDYVSSSKIEAQEIIRKGLDLMIKEVG